MCVQGVPVQTNSFITLSCINLEQEFKSRWPIICFCFGEGNDVVMEFGLLVVARERFSESITVCFGFFDKYPADLKGVVSK